MRVEFEMKVGEVLSLVRQLGAFPYFILIALALCNRGRYKNSRFLTSYFSCKLTDYDPDLSLITTSNFLVDGGISGAYLTPLDN